MKRLATLAIAAGLLLSLAAPASAASSYVAASANSPNPEISYNYSIVGPDCPSYENPYAKIIIKFAWDPDLYDGTAAPMDFYASLVMEGQRENGTSYQKSKVVRSDSQISAARAYATGWKLLKDTRNNITFKVTGPADADIDHLTFQFWPDEPGFRDFYPAIWVKAKYGCE